MGTISKGTAKVRTFSESASVLAIFFHKKCIFFEKHAFFSLLTPIISHIKERINQKKPEQEFLTPAKLTFISYYYLMNCLLTLVPCLTI